MPRTSPAGMTFLVVGGGALGNEVLKNLGLLGAGRAIVVDPDIVEASNLSRSVFFHGSDCGRPKATTLRASLTSAFPDTQWRSYDCEIADLGFASLAGVALILTCADNDLARMEAAWLALCLDVPMVDGGLGGSEYWHGRVSFFAGRQAACFCCKLTPRRRRELLSLSLAAGHPCQQRTETTLLPSTPTMASIVGALQVDFGLKCLHELAHRDQENENDRPARTIEISLGSTTVVRRFATPLSKGCPFHEAAQAQRFALPHPRASARELLDSEGAETVDLDWPICTEARCLDCGSGWQPMRRVAWLRRRGACPHCTSHRILENEVISTLNLNSRWIDTPLVELGLPDHHLYAIGPEPGQPKGVA
ncbi:MAG TPA: ThiF family adenylyltransferase [Candidatus Angelobacter sp.]|nr:ThiF family adenylyltransferase [Candidatus Angelobacter sp.]